MKGRGRRRYAPRSVVEIEFEIRWDGDALDTGEMRVRDLAPSLLAAVEILQRLNDEVGVTESVQVNLKATDRGSYVVSLRVFYDVAVNLLTSDDATAAGVLATILSLFVGIPGLVIAMAAKGSPSEVDTTNAATAKLTYPDGTTLELPGAILRMLEEYPLRQALYDFVRPLEQPGIDRMAIEQQGGPLAVVTKDQVHAFVPPDPKGPIDRTSATWRSYFTVVSPSFEPGYAWRLNDGAKTLPYGVTDPQVSNDLRGDRYGQGDQIECTVRQVQTRTPSGLSTNYEIVQVHNHVPAPQQGTIPLAPPD